MKTTKVSCAFFSVLLYFCLIHAEPIDGQIRRSGPLTMGYGGVFYMKTPNAMIWFSPEEKGLQLAVTNSKKKRIKTEIIPTGTTLKSIAFTDDFKYLMLLINRIVPDGYDPHAVKIICLTEAPPEHLGKGEDGFPLFTAETLGREGLAFSDFGFSDINTSKEPGKFSISADSYKSGNLQKEEVIQLDPGDPDSIAAAFKTLKAMQD